MSAGGPVKITIDIGAPSERPLREWLEGVAMLRIRYALLIHGGDVREAARWLGMKRVTLYRWLWRDGWGKGEEQEAG